MADTPTDMRAEIDEIPAAAERLLATGMDAVDRAADALRAEEPAFLATVARGSSDHVATFLKYACELVLGVPVASLAPSIASIYKRPLRLAGGAVISVSQSGASPDIVSTAMAARARGALTIAITNNRASRLAEASAYAIDICAGPERSVAATKTVVTSMMVCLALLARWSRDRQLDAALKALPETLSAAIGNDWSDLGEALLERDSLYVLGRGRAFRYLRKRR